MTPLEKAIRAFDGSVTKLADALGATPQVIVNWRKRGIPADRALDIEEATRATECPVTAAEVLEDAKRRNEARAA